MFQYHCWWPDTDMIRNDGIRVRLVTLYRPLTCNYHAYISLFTLVNHNVPKNILFYNKPKLSLY